MSGWRRGLSVPQQHKFGRRARFPGISLRRKKGNVAHWSINAYIRDIEGYRSNVVGIEV